MIPELPAIGLLAEFEEEDRRMLSSYGEFAKVHKGDKLIRQGAAQDKLYFVVTGLLHATCVREGRHMLLGKIESGEWFGEINVFDPANASATVEAMQFSQVWSITRKGIEQFFENYPTAGLSLVISIACLLSNRLRKLDEKLTVAKQLSNISESVRPQES